jgi:hypothetical protein
MSRQEILDFQARWMRPAGIAAIVGAALLVASVVVGSVDSADETAEQLELYHDHAGRYLFARIFSGLGLILFAAVLYFLFRSARARVEAMRSFLGPLIALGAVLVAVQGVLLSLGLKDASDQYVAGVARVEAQARQAATQDQQSQSKPQAEGGGEGKAATPTAGAGGTTTAGTTTAGTTTTAGAVQPRTVEQRVTDAKDNFADDRVDNSGAVQAATPIGLFGVLSLIAGAIYTLVWTIRTGLLTRFMGTLGMVFLAALLLIPQLGSFGTLLWFAVLGLMLAGWWIRPLPPAWAAGEAIPWPRPGEDLGPPPEERPQGPVEGSGREISAEPLPEDGAGAEQPRETPGRRRRKRKRRK